MMAAICFFSGINLLFMGLIGEYVGRIFQGMSNNPQFVVRAVHEHKAEDKNTEKNKTSGFPPLEEENLVCGTADRRMVTDCPRKENRMAYEAVHREDMT